jgi:hypothetical protein
MSKETFEKHSVELWEKLINDGYFGIMQYKPFSDQYWNEKYKIVICNYENFGYSDSQINSLNHNNFKGWIKYKKSKTVHYSAVFANSIKTMIEQKDFKIIDMKRSYWEIDKIWASMKNMVYMNIRPTSGVNAGRQNIKETHNIIKKYKNEIKNYIDSLEANIFIISSKDSVVLLNYLYDLDENRLLFDGKTKIKNMYVYSVRHFGWFFNYGYYYKKAAKIVYDVFHL